MRWLGKKPRRSAAEAAGAAGAAGAGDGAKVAALNVRRRMRVGDVISTASLGPRTRKARAGLSALGIAIGIAALVSLVGIPASQQEHVQRELEAKGATLITVYPGENKQDQTPIPIPQTAPEMVQRIAPVEAVVTRRELPDVAVYRNDKIPAGNTGGIAAAVVDGNLLRTLNVKMADGAWFTEAGRTLPTVVLGDAAARRLRAEVGSRLWIDSSWWAVVGILDPMTLAEELDSTAFLAPEAAEKIYTKLPIASMYVASAQGKTKSVRQVMAATVNPANPQGVTVSSLSDYADAAEMMQDTFAKLSLGLGAVALLVGGIGIANTMVVAVMERRGEVGLRRAMGARTGQITLQFALEAALMGFLGGVMGVAIGAYVVFCYTAWIHIAFMIPWWVVVCGPLISMALGMIAGLYPALKAARLSPTTALRAI
jgi:putative ABC transport system permease protein